MSIENKKSIEDILICENCGEDLSIYDSECINFKLNNNGFYSANCWCPACNAHARISLYFNYEITKSVTKYWEVRE